MVYVYLDIDIDSTRAKHARCHAFVSQTSLRYGFSSNDLRKLGGSELSRVKESFEVDHDWKQKGDIVVKRVHQSRIVVKLYDKSCPLAAENFLRLAIGKEKDPLLTYKGCKFHRVVKGFCCQTGDMQFGNGTGGESVYGKKFKDEKLGLAMKHDRRGLLSMGNSGKNSNTSQFFFTLQALPVCDGKHVVFGEIVSGMDVLDQIEACAGPEETPQVDVTITECGQWDPLSMPSSGYWLDIYDKDSFTLQTPVFMVWVRCGILAPSAVILDRFMELLKGCVCVEVESVEQGREYLSGCNLDVLVIAPALGIDGSENILVSKPVNALERVQNWAKVKAASVKNIVVSLDDMYY